MYVCVCKAVTEQEVRAAVAEGCHTMRDLGRELGVATECGRCASCARHVLHEARHTDGETHGHGHHGHHGHPTLAALAAA